VSRLRELCQEVRDVLADRLPPAATVERASVVDVKRAEPARKVVRVYGLGYGVAERVARRRVHKEYRVGVEVIEEYEDAADPGTGSPVPEDWLDDRIDWVEENVFTLLDNLGVEIKDRLLGACWPHTCEVTMVFDPLLLQSKVFRSSVEVAYREQVEG
jgi:hypothetical protein